VQFQARHENLETQLARREAAEGESDGVQPWMENELRHHLDAESLVHT